MGGAIFWEERWPRIESRFRSTAESRSQRQAYESLLKELFEHYEAALFQGKSHHIEKAKRRGRLLARERVEYLLDEGSPFLELLPLAGLGGSASSPGGTMVGGIGLVAGRWALITANVGTEKGGAIDGPTLQKSLRLAEIARENRLPTINFVESGGADLAEQVKVFNYGGAVFREITQRSKLGLPTISIVMGNATAGGAYVPGMSEYTIFVREQAQVFLGGPPLVKMATNEIVDEETLGGAQMHATVSGLADYLAQNEWEAIQTARRLMTQIATYWPAPAYLEGAASPYYDPDELLEILPPHPSKPFEIRELLARLVDESRFLEFKPLWGATLVTGWARVNGFPVGILANNGVLFPESAAKGAHFIQLCNRMGIPILFLQNITGFMVGAAYERAGIIKAGAQLINAVSNSEVPHLTLIVGASYGAGNYAMAGRSYKPRFLWSFPSSRIAVMGGEQLAGVMEIIRRQAAEASGEPFDEAQNQLLRTMLIQEVEKTSNPWYATGQLWDDGVIDPRETRNYLTIALSILYTNLEKPSQVYGVFRF